MATTPIKYRISSVATKPSADSVKGAALTSLEIDGNFRSLKDSVETESGRIDTILANGFGVQTVAATAPLTSTGGANPSISFTGILAPAKGGTGVAGVSGIMKGNGTSNVSAAVAGTDYVTPAGSETLSNKNLTAATNTFPSTLVATSGNQTIGGTKTFSSTITGSITGNAGTVTNGVYTAGDQTIGGTKTFSSTIVGSITGNAATVNDGSVTPPKLSAGGPKWNTSGSVSFGSEVTPSQLSSSITFGTNGLVYSTSGSSSSIFGAYYDGGWKIKYQNVTPVVSSLTPSGALWQTATAGSAGDSIPVFTTLAEIQSGGNFKFDSGYGSAAVAYGCRAWVNFDGTGTGLAGGATQTKRGSGNISVVSKSSIGTYLIYLETAMPDTNYAVVGTGITSSGETCALACTSQLTDRFTVTTNGTGTSAGLVDVVIANIVVFR